MGLTFRNMHKPLSWRNCPACHCSLVDAEISDPMKFTCEPGAFHSKLLGGRNPETWEMEYWFSNGEYRSRRFSENSSRKRSLCCNRVN